MRGAGADLSFTPLARGHVRCSIVLAALKTLSAVSSASSGIGSLSSWKGEAGRFPHALWSSPSGRRDVVYLQPINYPTVPRGTECQRITPTAAHDGRLIEQLVTALVSVWRELSLPLADRVSIPGAACTDRADQQLLTADEIGSLIHR
jgi:hypothetical protein